ncbi:hypothetical protein JKF63_00760 [Porcisia hertigi]|uniref:Uncharacterized protein n=1 Tax=Porcisia hertigi TaxID=2761500 RepID=A0A836KXG7_9TRYP|nr:hypothetical protein JKF63_00760 [Porcisia hertigi]
MDSSLSKHVDSVRSAHSYDRQVSNSNRTLSSFVVMNEKRSWRPSSSLFHPILTFMPNPAPLALAAANPFLRLFVERNMEGGGFVMCDYQVTPVTLEQNPCGCEDVGEADALARDTNRYGLNGGLFGGVDPFGDRASFEHSGVCSGTSGLVVEEDGPVDTWASEEENDESAHEYRSDPPLSQSVGASCVIPLYIKGMGASQGLSPLSNHCYPFVGVNRVAPSATQMVSRSFKPNATTAADLRDRDCLWECWQSTALEMSLCVSVTCKSNASLHFATLGAWWLSRYYGISLRLHHMHPAQLTAFKAVQRELLLKEICLENCVISEDLLQCISACSNLLSLSIISCSASQPVTLRCIDSILCKGSEIRSAGLSDAPHSPPLDGDANGGAGREDGVRRGFDTSRSNEFPARGKSLHDLREVTNLYVSGVRPLGSLTQLRCLHILHTPLHDSFLQALTTCTSLECLILHRCRGVRSLEPLQRLGNLQSLSLHGLSVTDTDLLPLTGCTRLRQLVLDECRQITDLSFLAKLRGTLERLRMPRTQLSNANMQHIGLCDKLVELHLQSIRQLTDVDALKNLTALRVLNLSDNLVTDEGCSALHCMPSLQRLNLASCRCIKSLTAGLSTYGRWTHRLLSLDLSQTNITDAGMQCVQQCADLRYLNLSGCKSLKRLSWLQKMSFLRWLHLGGTRVTDDETNRYLSLARNLRFLSLGGCSSVRSLIFAGNLPQLEYLNLESTGVSDSELSCLCRCGKLRYLSLRSCVDIRDISPLSLLPALVELNVSLTALGSSAGDTLSTTPDGSDGQGSAPGSPTFVCSAPSRVSKESSSPLSSLTSGPSGSLGIGASCFAVLQVLHLNGCSRVTRLEGLERTFPELRVLYANRISLISTRIAGMGFAGTLRRGSTGSTAQKRGLPQLTRSVSVNVGVAKGESLHPANKSATHLDQVLQQYVPQPPATPRPRTAHEGVSDPFHRSRSRGSKPTAKDRSEVLRSSGKTVRVLRLVLRRSSVSDAILEQICVTFACVSCLDLTRCTQLQCLPGLERLYALRELTLTQSSVDNDGVRAVSACETLEVLRLTECRNVTDVNCIGRLRRLRVLCVAGTQLTNQGLEGVGQCFALQYLNCAECRYLSDVNVLSSLKHLVELHLERTDVVDTGISGILRCSALQRVYFTRCQRLTTVGDVRAFLPQLEVLDVYGTSIPTRVAGQGQQFACLVM